MSMNLGGGKGGIKADINVTPLVDIMLVLLIIMMLIAPLLQKGVNVKLPIADHVVDKPDTQQQTVVHVTKEERFFVNNIEVNPRDLVDRIRTSLEDKREKVVYLKADAEAPYGKVMTMMDQLHEAQIENVGLITETRRKPGEAGTGGN
jgi:biopolymer transport protein TolR